ncbi:hypothetical protein A8M77_21050 [Variovorax sp. JS1663]|nr:hypothetical protein A8M77_21050 [Variovorax sp. JS1663]
MQIRFLGGTKKMMAVHRLVAEVHCGNPHGLPEVNHRDGVKAHNAASNLEWVTRAENIQHAVRTGLHRARPEHARATRQSVAALRDTGLTMQQVADALGCGLATVHRYEHMAGGA